LPTADVALAALANGGAIVTASVEDACQAVDQLAPEHLELLTRDAARTDTPGQPVAESLRERRA